MIDAANYYEWPRTEILKFVPDNVKTTLDIGCGQGTFSAALKEKFNANTWGIEPVTAMAKIAETKLDKVLCGLFDEVYDELPESYFDCAFCNDVLEHMWEPEEVLKKLKKNLKPNGRVIASIPNFRFLGNLKHILLQKDWKYANAGILDRTHMRFFTKKSMERMFLECGYEIELIEGINTDKRWRFKLFKFLALGLLSDTLSVQYLIIAKPVVK
jgi:2-polyprenyl-3-methyl-5-hydroxy-6-metoxy-1,4-benzoquinol methylase